jgi:hypothetical protein
MLASIGQPLRPQELHCFVLDGLNEECIILVEVVRSRDTHMLAYDIYARILSTEQLLGVRCSTLINSPSAHLVKYGGKPPRQPLFEVHASSYLLGSSHSTAKPMYSPRLLRVPEALLHILHVMMGKHTTSMVLAVQKRRANSVMFLDMFPRSALNSSTNCFLACIIERPRMSPRKGLGMG